MEEQPANERPLAHETGGEQLSDQRGDRDVGRIVRAGGDHALRALHPGLLQQAGVTGIPFENQHALFAGQFNAPGLGALLDRHDKSVPTAGVQGEAQSQIPQTTDDDLISTPRPSQPKEQQLVAKELQESEEPQHKEQRGSAKAARVQWPGNFAVEMNAVREKQLDRVVGDRQRVRLMSAIHRLPRCGWMRSIQLVLVFPVSPKTEHQRDHREDRESPLPPT